MAGIPKGQANCESIGNVCDVEKTACVERETGYTFTELRDGNFQSYPLIFCGDPPNEPTCVASRPGFIMESRDTRYCGIYPVGGIKDFDHDGDSEGDAYAPNPLGH